MIGYKRKVAVWQAAKTEKENLMSTKSVFVTDGIVSDAEDTSLLLKGIDDQLKRERKPLRTGMLASFGRLPDWGQTVAWLIPGIPLTLWVVHLISVHLLH